MQQQGKTMDQARLPQPLKVVEIKAENDYTKTFILDGTLAANPGQFVMAWLPGLEDKPFSLSNADPVSLTVAAVGPLSGAIHWLAVGDRLWVRGPLGRGFELPVGVASAKHLLLVGGGYGVAPLLFLTRQALARGHDISMIIGARTQRDLLMVKAFEQLGVSLWLTTEDGSQGIAGRVTGALPLVFEQSALKPGGVYACGPTGMLEAIAARCTAEKVPFQLAWEAHMRCGIGLCGSCEVGEGWLTCLDGPMFPFNPIVQSPAVVEGSPLMEDKQGAGR
jgi:dihydroorotate dehydrogenase electron transfer subunit